MESKTINKWLGTRLFRGHSYCVICSNLNKIPRNENFSFRSENLSRDSGLFAGELSEQNINMLLSATAKRKPAE
jgi:hypothetical protein